MDFKVYGWMTEKLGLKKNQLLVYALLYSYYQSESNATALSMSEIAGNLGISELAVKKNIAKLIEKGYIEKAKAPCDMRLRVITILPIEGDI